MSEKNKQAFNDFYKALHFKYERIEKEIQDYYSILSHRKKQINKVITMLKNNIDIETVATTTYLNIEDVKKIWKDYQQGIKDVKLETAKNMLKINMDISLISMITRLSAEEIEAIREV